jgi:predicted phosphodiesterase
MKYLIVSDIHSNREAFTTVLNFMKRKSWDKTVFLGDLVGYGADPNEAVDMLRRLKPLVAVRGNHDKVCSGLEDGRLFNPIALNAAQWTQSRLTAANRRFLQALPQGPRVVDKTFAISHGTPVDEDAYIFGEIDALNVFRQTDYELCFFGHSHFPVVFSLTPEAVTGYPALTHTFKMKLKKGARYLVNPGSVGQPRDGSPLASFALYDSEKRALTIHRLAYPVVRAQKKIYKAGLPKPLGDRLSLGR